MLPIDPPPGHPEPPHPAPDVGSTASLLWDERAAEFGPDGGLHQLAIPLGGPPLPGLAGRWLAQDVNARCQRSRSETRVIVLVGPTPTGQRLLVLVVAHGAANGVVEERELGRHLAAALTQLASEMVGPKPPC